MNTDIRSAHSRDSWTSCYVYVITDLYGVCDCIQAARDGLLDVVKAHLDSCLARIDDVDDDGYTAMHYAARYNRVSVMEVLCAAGAGIRQTIRLLCQFLTHL